MLDRAVVFSLTSSPNLTKEVCRLAGVEEGEAEVLHFADGEILAKSKHTVRGKDVYIIQSTCNPVTERLMELLVFIDSLKRASAREITAIIPYFGYARQDRKSRSREPITSRLVADLLKTSGVDRVVTYDLHAPQIQGYFSCPEDNLLFSTQLGEYFKDLLGDNEDICVVSPDHGGVGRARKLAEQLNATIAIFDKRRPKPNVAEMMNVIGDIEGKTCILVDDMIDTAGTICSAAEELVKRGAKKVYAGCTHPVFSGPALERLEKAPIDQIVCSNTIELTKTIDKIKVLSIAPSLAFVIRSIENGESIAPLFNEK